MKTVSCDDLGAGVQNNYTNAFYRPKMNPWYEKWMPDLTKDGTKAVYTITLQKTDNRTGKRDGDDDVLPDSESKEKKKRKTTTITTTTGREQKTQNPKAEAKKKEIKNQHKNKKKTNKTPI